MLLLEYSSNVFNLCIAETVTIFTTQVTGAVFGAVSKRAAGLQYEKNYLSTRASSPLGARAREPGPWYIKVA